MTPAQIETAARQRYNAEDDQYFSSAEVLNIIYAACLEMCTEVPELVERTYTASTVASQREYSFPTNTISIKRIEYEGQKLKPITMREDDAITLYNADTTDTGTPQYYFTWDETIYLRPIPSGVGDLVIYSYNEPQVLTSSSTLEIPTLFHMGLVDYVVSEFAAKDQNFKQASRYRDIWEAWKLKAKRWAKKRKRGDSYVGVHNEETIPIVVGS